MRLAIIGYGKMGKAIERIAEERGHDVVLRATSKAPALPEHLEGVDAAIEFTSPHSAADNLLACMEAGVPVVCGSTGWYTRLAEVSHAASHHDGALLYATNFSIGVNVFNVLVKRASEIMSRLDEYTPSIKEAHHMSKKDAPSGTALTISDIVLDHYQQFDGWTDDMEVENKLPIESIREGDVKGLHTVNFTSSIDQIRLTHEAFSRGGFALGAVQGAEWLKDKTGVFTIGDMLQNLLK
ncbi:MAG: 4-hydroxy-tetrahydrodipicolinate reductase [Flavobacteriales bacterium]|nr:4-hydroxy-tetrahydrodipicolinate reductase [Flavobacteriales bacterium]